MVMPTMTRFMTAAIASLVAAFAATSGKVMPHTQPIVDAGLFVISGVMTCGEGRGYCLLGMDCTLDEEFLPDPQGHCKGLQNAFTPSAYFSCCKYKNLTGQDNFIYTMVDPAVSTLVNSYTDSTTEKMSMEHDSFNNNDNLNQNEHLSNNFNDNFKENNKKEPDPVKDANILEEFNKHMENVKLKNEDKNKKPLSTITPFEDEIVPVVSNVSINGEDSDSDEDSTEEQDDEEEEDESEDVKSDDNDIKTIQLGESSGDRDEKETNEADEDYDSNESDQKEETIKESTKDKDHMKKVDLGHKMETQTVTADSVVDNVKQFLKDKVTSKPTKTENPTKTAKPTKTTSKPPVSPVKINMIQSGDHKDQEKVAMEAVKQEYPDQQTTSEKLCMRKKNAPKCRTVWKFMHQQRTLCSGTMLDQIWMLTSATCLERLVQVGLRNVTLESHKDWRISNVVAYEGFRSEYNHTHHDIGLVRLMAPIQRSICVPCIPRLNQKFVGSECSAPFSSSSQRSGSALLCQGLSEAYHSHGDEFMSLACRNPAGTHHNISDWNSGNGIICRGYLAGLQTPVRTEQLVYLQVNPYVKWIQDNMKSTGISQKFNLDSIGS